MCISFVYCLRVALTKLLVGLLLCKTNIAYTNFNPKVKFAMDKIKIIVSHTACEIMRGV